MPYHHGYRSLDVVIIVILVCVITSITWYGFGRHEDGRRTNNYGLDHRDRDHRDREYLNMLELILSDVFPTQCRMSFGIVKQGQENRNVYPKYRREETILKHEISVTKINCK